MAGHHVPYNDLTVITGCGQQVWRAERDGENVFFVTVFLQYAENFLWLLGIFRVICSLFGPAVIMPLQNPSFLIGSNASYITSPTAFSVDS